MVGSNPLDQADLLKSILQYTPLRNVLLATSVSKFWETVIGDLRFHPEKIELQFSGSDIDTENASIRILDGETEEADCAQILEKVPQRISSLVDRISLVDFPENMDLIDYFDLDGIYFSELKEIWFVNLHDVANVQLHIFNILFRCDVTKVEKLFISDVHFELPTIINMFPAINDLHIDFEDCDEMIPIDFNDLNLDVIDTVKCCVGDIISFRGKARCLTLTSSYLDVDPVAFTANNLKGVTNLKIEICEYNRPGDDVPDPNPLRVILENRLEMCDFLDKVTIFAIAFNNNAKHTPVVPQKPTWASSAISGGQKIHYMK